MTTQLQTPNRTGGPVTEERTLSHKVSRGQHNSPEQRFLYGPKVISVEAEISECIVKLQCSSTCTVTNSSFPLSFVFATWPEVEL